MLANPFKIVFATLLILTTTPLYAKTPAQELQTILNDLKSLKTQFVQQVRSSQNKLIQKSTGTMYLQRPGKFRWEAKAPIEQWIIADGKHIWIYDIELEQVTIKDFTKSIANSPGLLLSGTNQSITDDYSVESTQTGSPIKTFKLTPKAPESTFKTIHLSFKKNIIQTMKLKDNLDQTTTVIFKNTQFNPTLPAKLFQFKPPKGVDVISQLSLRTQP